MKDRYTGKSRGFGFVSFADAASAIRAMNTEHCIDGRRCEAKVALPKVRAGLDCVARSRLWCHAAPSEHAHAAMQHSKAGDAGCMLQAVHSKLVANHSLGAYLMSTSVLHRATPRRPAPLASLSPASHLPSRRRSSAPTLRALASCRTRTCPRTTPSRATGASASSRMPAPTLWRRSSSLTAAVDTAAHSL